MADGRLRAAGWLDEIARADLVLGGRDERQQPQPDRVGERREHLGDQLSLVFVKAVLSDRRAAGDGIERCRAAGYHGHTVSKIFEEVH